MGSAITIRPVSVADAAIAADLRRRATPHFGLSAEGMAVRLGGSERLLGWLAYSGRTARGFAFCRPPAQGRARLGILVPPEERRHGVGSAMLAAADAALDGPALTITGIADEPDGTAFAVAHGFTVGRRHRFSAVDTGHVAEPPPCDPEVSVVPLSDVAPRAVWSLHQRVSLDDPSGLAVPTSYENWLEEEWTFPDHAPDLGVAAICDGQVVAFTQVVLDPVERAMWTPMTGVDQRYRGRGLARLVKATALIAARDAGVTRAFTVNDGANAPMLAVNDALGFQPTGTSCAVERRPQTTGGAGA